MRDLATARLVDLTAEEFDALARAKITRVFTLFSDVGIRMEDLGRAVAALDWQNARCRVCATVLGPGQKQELVVVRGPVATLDPVEETKPDDDDCMDAAMDLLHRLRHMSLRQANAVLDITRIAVATRLSTEQS